MKRFLIGVMLLSACGSKDREIRSWDLETMVEKQLSAGSKKRPPSVHCNEPLHAHVGASTTCWMNIQDKPHDVTVTITSVDGSTASFDIEVAEESRAEKAHH